MTWLAYLIDPFGTQTVIDLRFQVKRSIDDETLSSKIINSEFS